jgi:glutamate/aspartate transport system substrate-binding protein
MRSPLTSAIAAASLLLATLLAGPAAAQELTGTLKKIKSSGSITVGHRETLLPFSYYDNNQKVVGYSADLCAEVLTAIRTHLRMDALDVKLMPVTSASRIPLLVSGAIDLECGATTNNLDRQKQVAFSVTHFVTSNRFVAKKANRLSTLDDLRGRQVVSVSGTSNIKQIQELNGQRNLGLNVMAVKDHAEAFLTVETDRASAFVMDDVILAAFVSNAKDPSAYAISPTPLSLEPYAFMLRKDDPDFKRVVDSALAAVYASGKVQAIYDKWFQRPIPPKGNNLNMPMPEALKKVIARPTDSGDPAAY